MKRNPTLCIVTMAATLGLAACSGGDLTRNFGPDRALETARLGVLTRSSLMKTSQVIFFGSSRVCKTHKPTMMVKLSVQ